MIFPELEYDHDESGRLYTWVSWYEIPQEDVRKSFAISQRLSN